MCQVASQQGKTKRKSSTENTEAKEQSCEMWEEGSWQQSPAGPVLLQSVKHVGGSMHGKPKDTTRGPQGHPSELLPGFSKGCPCEGPGSDKTAHCVLCIFSPKSHSVTIIPQTSG